MLFSSCSGPHLCSLPAIGRHLLLERVTKMNGGPSLTAISMGLLLSRKMKGWERREARNSDGWRRTDCIAQFSKLGFS